MDKLIASHLESDNILSCPCFIFYLKLKLYRATKLESYSCRARGGQLEVRYGARERERELER